MVRVLRPAGIAEHGKCIQGFYGNLGEPPTSIRKAVNKDIPHPKCPGLSGLYCHLIRRKESGNTVNGIQYPRETEGEETGEGSLSISIVPFVVGEVQSERADVGKGVCLYLRSN